MSKTNSQSEFSWKGLSSQNVIDIINHFNSDTGYQVDPKDLDAYLVDRGAYKGTAFKVNVPRRINNKIDLDAIFLWIYDNGSVIFTNWTDSPLDKVPGALEIYKIILDNFDPNA